MKSETLLTVAAIAGGAYVLLQSTKGIQTASSGIGSGVSNAIRGVGSSVGEVVQGVSSPFQFTDEYFQRQSDIQNYNRQYDLDSGYSQSLRQQQQNYELQQDKYNQEGNTVQQREESSREAEASQFFSEVQTSGFNMLRNTASGISKFASYTNPVSIMTNAAQNTYTYLMDKINAAKSKTVTDTIKDNFYSSKANIQDTVTALRKQTSSSVSSTLSSNTKTNTNTSSVRTKINSILGR